MKNVLVVGSLNMDYTIYVKDFPLEGETIYGKSRFIQAGGKGENQAVALAKSYLVNSYMIGAVGNDKDGEEILKILKDNGVKSHVIVKDGVETGNATITVNEGSENEIIIIAGANGKLAVSDIDLELLKKCDICVIQNEIPQETNEYVIKKAKEFNKIVVYNPAPYRDFDISILKDVDYFIPNKVEFEKCTGTDNLEEGMKKLLDLGVKNLLVTLGTKGSVLVNKNEKIFVEANKVNAIDTVGAGDTYIGYFVAALASGRSHELAMRIASKASSICVTKKGSLVSIPYGEEVYEG